MNPDPELRVGALRTRLARCRELPSLAAYDVLAQDAIDALAATPEHRPPIRALLKLNRVYSGGKVTMDADAFDDIVLGDDA